MKQDNNDILSNQGCKKVENPQHTYHQSDADGLNSVLMDKLNAFLNDCSHDIFNSKNHSVGNQSVLTENNAIDPLALSIELLKFKTITPEDDGCLEWIAKFLSILGFEIHWLNSANIKNLFATIELPVSLETDKKHNHICFAGHTDVVPTGENWTYPPFSPTVHDGKLYARGTADMKCAIACWLSAVAKKILLQNQTQTQTQTSTNPNSIQRISIPRVSIQRISIPRVSILLTSDEEAEAVNGLRTTIDFLKTQNIDLFVLGEPTSVEKAGDCVKIGRRGSVTVKLTVFGKQGHIAYPNFAANPIDLLDKVFYALEAKLADTEVYPFGACKIVRTSIDVGNTAENVIPGKAVMCFGIRFNTLFDVDSISTLIEEVCQETLEKYELQISRHGNAFLTDNPETLSWVRNCVKEALGSKPLYTEHESKENQYNKNQNTANHHIENHQTNKHATENVAQMLDAKHELMLDAKHELMLDAKGATSDGRFLSAVADVIECGFLENQAHQKDEYVSLSDLEIMEAIYLQMLS